MKLISIKYEGGKANGFAQGVPDNTHTIHYGNKGDEETYTRTDRTDRKGRVIFTVIDVVCPASAGSTKPTAPCPTLTNR